MRVAGAIIAGGKASRMNFREKLLLPLGTVCFLDAILARIRPQVDALALDVRRQSRSLYASFEGTGVVLISDPYSGTIGPLGGIVGALGWLQTLPPEYEWLATFPGDCPSLPDNLVATLYAVRPLCEPSRPVVAFDGERIQSLFALWPRGSLARLEEGISQHAFQSVHQSLNALGAVRCPVRNGFRNVNTPADLAHAEQSFLAHKQSTWIDS
jgi:molybdopterin-guanine dinucleotide biosynthesis protein A